VSVDKWEQRMLCPDGACVGVIGMNGQCKVCGTAVPDWGDPRKPGRVSSKAEADEAEPEEPEDDDEDVEEEDEDEAAEPAKAKEGEDEEKRRLCPDGSCIGLIGDDNKCKVCGKAAEGDEGDDDDEDEDDDEYEDDEEAAEGEADDKPALPQLDQSKVAKDDDENRTLCTDGACVGVIGTDGKCKVCGKAAA
jgi:hypothetical protein